MEEYDVNLVADYVIFRLTSDEKHTLINLKLQKLIYYIQAWAYGILGRRFINCSFEAWVHGPVCRQLYDRFKDTKNLYSFMSPADMIERDFGVIRVDDREFIDYILDNYAGYTGIQLENMTHLETPWIEARQGFQPMEHSDNILSDDSIRLYFEEKWKNINGE